MGTTGPTAAELARAARRAVGLDPEGPLDTRGRSDPLASQRRLATYLCLLPWWGHRKPADVAEALGLARFAVQATRTTMAPLDDRGQPVYVSEDARAIEAVAALLLRFNFLVTAGELPAGDAGPSAEDMVLAYQALRRRPKDWGGRPRGASD